MHINNVIVLKFGTKDEALDSMANYYQVNTSDIKKKWGKLKEIYSDYFSHSDDNLLLKNICSLLVNCDSIQINDKKIILHFYHRTSFSGKKEWFINGILDGSGGIKQYISNLQELCPEINLIEYKKNLEQLNNYKHSFAKKSYGPYAFLNKKSAMSNHNNYYDQPEIIYDKATDLIPIIKKHLKPCVVEFFMEYDNYFIDKFLLNYWRLLLDESNGECGGVEVYNTNYVPYENIVSIHHIQ